MLLNTAGQSIGAQMLTLSDGSDFTSAVTVYVTGNSGTQAIGSVGSGLCTHEGNGYHSYRPSQAETNYAHIAFTFKGTGAATVTAQVFTRDAIQDANIAEVNNVEITGTGVAGDRFRPA